MDCGSGQNMRFKHRRHSSTPDVNLVPMLDVLLTVLTFFIIISMTLVTQQGVQVQLPGDPNTAAPAQPDTAPLVAKLTAQGILLDEQAVTETQLKQQMQLYLAGNAQGVIVLQSDAEMPYEQVLQLLGEMKDIGGNRVSLAIDE